MKTETAFKKSVSFVDANGKRFVIDLEITGRNGYPEFTACGETGQCVDQIKPANEAQTTLVQLWHEWHLNGMKPGTDEQEQALKSEDFELFKKQVKELTDKAKVIENIVNGSFEKYCEFIGVPSSWSSAKQDYNKLRKIWNGESVSPVNDFFNYVKSIPEGLRPKFDWNSHVPPNKIKDIFGSSYDISTAYLQTKNLLVVPHPVTGQPYNYGSEWLRKDLPSDFEVTLDNLIEQIETLEEHRKGADLSTMSDSDLLELVEAQTTYENEEANLFCAIVRKFDLSVNDFDDVDIDGNNITVQGTDYLAGTDDEMDEKAKEYILETVWAFNASFLASQTGIDIAVFEAIQGNGKCEDNNKAILSMIDDEDEFVQAAIKADGRGHFLNSYDGKEDEQEFNGETYYFCSR